MRVIFPRPRIWVGALLCGAAAIVLALSLGDTTGGRSMAKLKHGLVLRREYGTEGFEYLFHEPSGKWVGRECEVRIEDKRRLPDPLVLTGPNPALSILLFGGLTTESAPITGGIENVQRFETYRWWWLAIPMGDDVVNSKSAQRVGVQVTWPPASDGSQEIEPMEVFVLPPIDSLPPETWTAWEGPHTLRAGESAWHGEVHRKLAPEPAPVGRTPTFEVRCRAGLWETIYRRTK
jgi:hypothetical protein